MNRVARPFYGEALRILDEGIADCSTIDWAMRTLGGFRMGPFELMDLIGNDVNFAVTSAVYEGFFFDPRYKPSLTQRRLVDANLLGRKTGRGWYDYRDGAVPPAPREEPALGSSILERILAMLINEATDAAGDIQTAGAVGLMAYADAGVTNAPLVAAFDDLDVTPAR